ncbi:MAG TPA: tyrosine-type recombinase/integrase [Anaerolineaceae bacterium]|nr:tyrosine-type recombinase/integrase [Anaerolineaceae bacterium]
MPPQSSPEVHITPQTLLPPALRAWEIYLRDQGRSINTIKAFMGDLQLLVDFLPPDQSIGSVTTRDLNHFLQWLQSGRGVPCSPKSLARRITSVKAFFRWLLKHGRITADPAEKVLQQSVISPLPEVLTPEEQQKLLQAALGMRQARKADARPYTLLKLLLETGIKKGECLNLSINHIDLAAPDGPVIFIRYAGSQNRYKERRIALSADWIASYQEYAAQYTPRDQVFPWSQRRLEYLLEDLGTEAGLVKHVSFDMCRWTCALNDYHNGVQPDAIRQKLGISKIQWREVHLKLRQLAGVGSDS